MDSLQKSVLCPENVELEIGSIIIGERKGKPRIRTLCMLITVYMLLIFVSTYSTLLDFNLTFSGNLCHDLSEDIDIKLRNSFKTLKLNSYKMKYLQKSI